MKVIIIGAGLAGPSMALALARQGIRSTIYERKATAEDIGGVVMLAANAVRVLDKIVGIEPDVRPLGYTFTGLELYAGGYGPMEHLGGIKFDITGATSITVKRPLFHELLLRLCEENELVDVQFGKSLKGIEEDSERVVALFEDGTSAEGDILIGVDGIHSRVRRHVVGQSEASKYNPQYTGHVVLGTKVPKADFHLSPGMVPPAFLFTPAGTILSFPTDPKADEFQWATFINTPERPKSEWEAYKTSGEALRDLKKVWGHLTSPPVKSLIDHVTSENIVVWWPYEVPDLERWSTPRVCLVGDSCHAISPSAGQGTAQALDDVGLLARLLSSQQALDQGYEALFGHYEKKRKARMEQVKVFMKGSLATRSSTPNSWLFWAKKTGFKALFFWQWMKGGQGNSALDYDVTKEDIVVQ